MAAPAQLLTGFAKTARTIKPNPTRRLTLRDPDSRGLFVRINPSGTRSWLAMARDPQGKQVWATIGDAMTMELSEARVKGREAVQRIKEGRLAIPKAEPPPPPPMTLKELAEQFLERHVQQEGLRTAAEIKRQFERYIYPEWQDEPFESITRARVNKLLRKIELDIQSRNEGSPRKRSGRVMANRVLATLRKMMNWVEVDSEWTPADGRDYHSPIVRGMRKNSAERKRERILSDDEIRALWADWSSAGTFGAFLQICLLTAQRRAKVLSLKWADISDDSVWTIAKEDREKASAGQLKLPKMANDILRSQPKIEGNEYVFAGRGNVPIGNIGNDKRKLDKRVQTEKPWTIHDLRRTAKSLMGVAGVRPDISERVLGHAIQGVEGVYDQYDYAPEKADALEKLARRVEMILNPPKGNVIPMQGAA